MWTIGKKVNKMLSFLLGRVTGRILITKVHDITTEEKKSTCLGDVLNTNTIKLKIKRERSLENQS